MCVYDTEVGDKSWRASPAKECEAKKSQVEQGGIISDPNVHANVLNILLSGYKKMGLSFIEIKKSRVLGRKGNQEFFCVLKIL